MTTKSCQPSPPPPPPPPPPSCGTWPSRVSSTPRPQHAAVPFICGDARAPVQETGDQGDNSHNFQLQTDSSTPPPPPPPPPQRGEGDTEADGGNKQHPVQETDPAPHAYENPQPSETPNPEGNVSTMDEDEDIQHSRSA